MTDDKVIKSLKWLVFNFPKIENPKDDTDKMCNCINLYCQNAIDLINRQETKIERLEKENHLKELEIKEFVLMIGECRAGAIKEFAERLKENKFTHKNFGELVVVEDIDNLVKEMTENDFKE